MRVLASIVAAVALVGSLPLWWWLQQRQPSADTSATAQPVPEPMQDQASETTQAIDPGVSIDPAPQANAPITPVAEPARPETPMPELITGPDPGRSPLADDLNAPEGSIEQDLAIVQKVLANYLLEFGAHPVGANREITAQLSGRNPQRHAPLPADLPAINPGGELIDRWGTPFFFHALSAREMEIRSAGPDRELYSADDAVWTPAPR